MKNKIQYGSGIVLLLLFLFLAFNVAWRTQGITVFDASIQQYFQQITTFKTAFFGQIAFWGSPSIEILLSIALCGYLWIRRRAGLGIWLLAVQLGGSLVITAIKFLVHRSRPMHQVIAERGFSFPSGHTFCAAIFVCSFLYFLFLLIKGPKRRVAMVLAGIVWVCLVAASRLYLRAHFASDVTGSMLFAGAFWLLIWSVKPVFDVCLAKILPKSILKGM